jgi:tetratricopeptide (TPR) repeat protein
MPLVRRVLPVLVLLTAGLVACASPEEKVAAHLTKARALMAAKDYDKARLEARSAVQILPKDADAHFILAQLAWRDGNVQEVFNQLSIALESNPKLLEARLRLGDIYFASGDARLAGEQAEAARALAPDDPGVHLLSGKVLFLQGDKEGAAREFDAALAKNPAFIDAITSKVSLQSIQGDNPGALAFLDRSTELVQGADQERLREFRLEFLLGTGQDAAYEAGITDLIKAFPDRTRYRYQLLDYYASRGRRDDEERLLRELVAADPGSATVKVRLARVLVGKKDTAGAEALLKDSLAKEPASAELQIALGDLYRYEKKSAEAMDAYRQAADRAPGTTAEGQTARNRIVAQHALDGRTPEARAGIEAILKEAPDNPDALLARATFAFLDRKYDAAIADLRTVVRRQQSADTLLLLARSYVGAGDPVVAKDTYRRLLDQYPGNAAAAKELAVLLSNQGDAAAAADILRRFVAARPDDPTVSAALVQSLLAQQDVAAAEAEARRLLERGAAGTEAEQQLGLVLQSRGANAEALARYRAVLEKEPTQPEALEGFVSVLLATNRAGEALDFLKKYPQGALQPSLLLARVHAAQGDMPAARAVLDEAIRANASDPRPYMGLASLAPTDSPGQLAALQRGWKALPGNPVIGVFLAGVLERKGKAEEAITVYEAVLKGDPANLMVANNLASLLLDARKDPASFAKALSLVQPYASGADAVTLDTLGWAYYRTGDFPSAVRQLERAVAADANNRSTQFHLGMAYAAAGNAANARQHLQAALEGDGAAAPHAVEARAALAKL